VPPSRPKPFNCRGQEGVVRPRSFAKGNAVAPFGFIQPNLLVQRELGQYRSADCQVRPGTATKRTLLLFQADEEEGFEYSEFTFHNARERSTSSYRGGR
jgi:hypothetical protein